MTDLAVPEMRTATRPRGHVTMSANGKNYSWIDGVFYGVPDRIEEANFAANAGLMVEMFGATIQAGYDDELGALAALWYANPGRAQVTSASPETIDYLLSLRAEEE